jgi:ectoine hydroxylase-related dioxygenase (phytanoyl-CoA dioxygenase family)
MRPTGHNENRAFGDTIYKGELPPLPYPERFDPSEAIEGMHRDGYCIIPSLLSKEEVQHYRTKMDTSGGPDEQYEFENWCFNKQLSSDYMHDLDMVRLTDPPEIVKVLEGCFGDYFQVIGGSMWITGKGRAMGVHVDSLPFPLPPGAASYPETTIPIFMATAHYYLDDLTLDLGPTTVVPGSHYAARPPDNETSFDGVGPHAVLVKAGDVCLFRSDLWHAAAMNTSDRRRYMIQVHYAHSTFGKWFPQVEWEHYWSPEVLAALTPRQRKLLGRPRHP